MASLKVSLLKQVQMPSPLNGRPVSAGVRMPAGVMINQVCTFVGRSLGRRTSSKEWTDMHVRGGVKGNGNNRPGSSRSYLYAVEPGVLLGRQDNPPAYVQFHQQTRTPSFCVAVIRPPLDPGSPDVKPSLNPFSPSIADPNLPSPSPSPATPPEFSPDAPPSEVPSPSPSEPGPGPEVPGTSPPPEFIPTTFPDPTIPATPSEIPTATPSESPIPSIPTEIPVISPAQFPPSDPSPTELPGPGQAPEFKPIGQTLTFAAEVPRGPPISPPNTPPIVPPGTPQPTPPPVVPPIVPPGTPQPVPPPQTPPIPPGMPGPVPPPTMPPGSPPPFPGPEIPSVPPPGPEIPNPPSIMGSNKQSSLA